MKAPPPPRVAVPVMYHRWAHMTFLHWRYPAQAVRELVPHALTVETFDGSACVTPFLLTDVPSAAPRRPLSARPLPPLRGSGDRLRM
ncbi:DUF2071 domain-containing protein [Nonomuraea sp. NPDC050451]|uniref:DUF2071 domain-containing protein n=1 Tax=Nonomuraea sp. NPDC050451 TaxID=3364364 RepID=UPI0037A900E7